MSSVFPAHSLSALLLTGVAAAACVPELPSQGAPAHTPMTAEKHQPLFPINSGSHAGVACNTCHGEYDSFHEFNCVNCHTAAIANPQHAAVPNYEWASARCYACHPASTVGAESIDHARYFPIEAGSKHANIACSTCHRVPGDKTQVTCTGTCHQETPTLGQHGAVGGYQYASTGCMGCHADSQVHNLTAHVPFKISLGTKHYRSPCIGCHTFKRTDKPWATEFLRAKISCSACHPQATMDPTHQGLPGYNYANQLSCLGIGCHSNGSRP